MDVLRTYARTVVKRMVDNGATDQHILGQQCGFHHPAGSTTPEYGYYIGGMLNHAIPVNYPDRVPPLPHHHIGVHVGDEVATFPLTELIREVRAGVSQPALF